jgi:hypothetical protein
LFFFLENQKVDPSVDFFLYKTDSINVEQEHDFHELLELAKLLVISKVFNDFKLFTISGISVNDLTPSRWLPGGLLFFVLHKLFFFHKVLTPTLERYPVV